MSSTEETNGGRQQGGKTKIEWFGASTFRVQSNGLTLLLDTWLEKPEGCRHFISVDDIKECDYIFISHAHFDHLPGADRIAKQTGAIIIGNGEAVTVMREAGVPEEQLVPVAGGERIPLFSKSDREAALRDGKAGMAGPPQPGHSLAKAVVHVWPSLHCLMPGEPGDHPDFIDTATEYHGAASPFACTLDITRIMKHGFVDPARNMTDDAIAKLPSEHKSIVEYLHDPKNHYSSFDGGQLAFNFLLEDKVFFWSSLLGGYEGVLKAVEPRPDIAVLGIAGRACIDGRPFDGSAAQAATKIVQWLGEPKTVIWDLYDEMPFKPRYTETTAATKLVESETRSKIRTLEPGALEEL